VIGLTVISSMPGMTPKGLAGLLFELFSVHPLGALTDRHRFGPTVTASLELQDAHSQRILRDVNLVAHDTILG
jgi:hypothetical protein